jgi:hypothetical protein
MAADLKEREKIKYDEDHENTLKGLAADKAAAKTDK